MGAKRAILCGYSAGQAEALQGVLGERDFEVGTRQRLEPSSQETRGADLIFCDLPSPGADEDYFPDLIEEIQILRITRRDLPIMCTSDGKHLDRIVQAVKAGASE
ncbi:MAG: hypothetical protein O2807_09245 [bacterium]|nr:hypothetical protein [bacterium]